MERNVYECLFIFDSNRYARDPNKVSSAIPAMVEELNGEILANRLWNEQRLAYPIKGQRKGTYWLTYFRLDSDRVTEFNRACRLNDNILRNLTLKVDPRLVDALVSHAQGTTTPAADDKPDKPETAPAADTNAAKEEPAKEEAAKVEPAEASAE